MKISNIISLILGMNNGLINILDFREMKIVLNTQIHQEKLISVDIITINEAKYFLSIDQKEEICVWNFNGKTQTFGNNNMISNTSLVNLEPNVFMLLTSEFNGEVRGYKIDHSGINLLTTISNFSKYYNNKNKILNPILSNIEILKLGNEKNPFVFLFNKFGNFGIFSYNI